MPKEELRNRKLNAPLGVFSQATKIEASGTLVFISGLTSRDPDGNVIGVGDVRKQTETILENMQTLLQDAGGSLDDVMKVTVFIRNMKDFDAIHEVRRRYFKPPLPASTMVEVSMLVSPELLIEIEAFAVIPNR
ncbi:MAG: RidA family protein [Firmicutes bacterium]|jgi:2-iminobutanoate/2-iminopropanoate deaminase|nr:RidA family protein [Bacillota bacterium]